MHGSHIAIAGPFQPVPLPATKTVAQMPSAQESFRLTWEKVIKAGTAGVQRGKSNTSAPKKPEIAANQNEKLEGAINPDEVAEDEAQESNEKSAPIAAPITIPAQTINALIEAQPQTKFAITSDNKVETTKHKVRDDRDLVAADEPKVIAQGSAMMDGLLVAPAPMVAQSSAPPVSVRDEAEDVVKTETTSAKRDRTNISSTDRAGKTTDTKPVQEIENTRALLVADVKAKVSDTDVASVVNHAGAHLAVTTEVNDSIASGVAGQEMVTSVVAATAHKTSGSQVSAELQSNALARVAGSDVNPAHVLAAGPGQLEVGVLDGTHGWLKIRAELGSDGSINALLTSNATAHEGLKEAVPALSGYLLSESLNVGRIAVHRPPEGSATGSDMTNANGGSGRRDDGTASPYQDADESTGSGKRLLSGNVYSATRQDIDSSMSGISAVLFGGASAGFDGNGIGSWLSVTA
jgi:hypothetical protein